MHGFEGLSSTPLWVDDGGGGDSVHQYMASAHGRMATILVIQTL